MISPVALIAQSFADYKTEAPVLIGYSAWLLVPFAAFVLISLLPLTPVVQVIAFLLILCELFLVIWVTIVLMFYAYAHAHGHEKNMGAFSAKTRTLMVPILTVTLLQLLIYMGGMILLLVPMFIFIVWFSLAWFAVLFEGRRGLEALAASRALTRGRFWNSAALLWGGPLLLFLLYSVVLSLIVSLIGAAQGLDPVTLMSGEIPLWIEILDAMAQVLLLPLFAIYPTRVYIALTSTVSPPSSRAN
ncbi:hypothetical protein FJZ23_03040 [Candidatus Parcubacteria bacterium]|nr:hypothetical protein [Candidatus Parcubacteria bacterium]